LTKREDILRTFTGVCGSCFCWNYREGSWNGSSTWHKKCKKSLTDRWSHPEQFYTSRQAQKWSIGIGGFWHAYILHGNERRVVRLHGDWERIVTLVGKTLENVMMTCVRLHSHIYKVNSWLTEPGCRRRHSTTGQGT